MGWDSHNAVGRSSFYMLEGYCQRATRTVRSDGADHFVKRWSPPLFLAIRCKTVGTAVFQCEQRWCHEKSPKPTRNRAFWKWSGAGSNRRHQDFQSCALPTELPDHVSVSSKWYVLVRSLSIRQRGDWIQPGSSGSQRRQLSCCKGLPVDRLLDICISDR